jgi:hypothetical protein
LIVSPIRQFDAKVKTALACCRAAMEATADEAFGADAVHHDGTGAYSTISPLMQVTIDRYNCTSAFLAQFVATRGFRPITALAETGGITLTVYRRNVSRRRS